MPDLNRIIESIVSEDDVRKFKESIKSTAAFHNLSGFLYLFFVFLLLAFVFIFSILPFMIGIDNTSPIK